MGTPNDQHFQPPRYEEADMVAAITRLGQQVSFVYNIIQSQRQEFKHINETVGGLQRDMEGAVAFMKCMRDDLRLGRFFHRAMDQSLYDPADVEVLATQTANVTTIADSVDNLTTENQLTQQRLQRLETQFAINFPSPLLSDAASRAAQQRHEAMRAQQTKQAPSCPLPTMCPGAALPSEHGRPPAPALETQPTPDFHPGQERRHLSANEQVHQASHQPGFRAVELHAPPAAVRGWRPAESCLLSGRPSPPSCYDPLQSQPPGSESQVSRLAGVDPSQVFKRALDEHQPQHGSDQHRLPKRPKLATLPPLKPGSSFHQYPYVQEAQMKPARQARGPVPSGKNPFGPHSHPAPGQRATNPHRFITPTGQPDNQEDRRATNGDQGVDARFEHSSTGATGRGRGHENSGERPGSSAASGRGSSGPTTIPAPASEAPKQDNLHKQVLTEWRKHHYSMVHGIDSVNNTTRTKPIRNSDGVLIRKDGRPDMRSVRSANNLRKPYVKDEKNSTQLELSAKRVASEPLPDKVAS